MAHLKAFMQHAAGVWFSLTRFQRTGLVLILLLGAVLRIQHIGRPMLYDETFTYEVYVGPGIVHSIARYDYPNNHIFHSILVSLSTFFGDNEITIRLPALMFSLLSLPLFFLFARRFFGTPAALYALLLLTLSRFHIDYAHNARGYSMNVFFTLLAAYGLFAVLERPRIEAKKYWGLYALAAVLSMYTLPTTLFFLAATGIFVPLYILLQRPPGGRSLFRDCIKYHLVIAAGSFLLYLPPLAFFIRYPDRIWLFGSQQSFSAAAAFPRIFLYLFSPFCDGNYRLLAVLIVLALCGLVLFWWTDGKKAALLACILAVPFGLLAVCGTGVFERNLLYLQPFLFLAIGLFLAQLQTYLPVRSGVAYAAAVILGIGLLGCRTTAADFLAKPDLDPRKTAVALNAAVRPGDALFVDFPIDNRIRYYLSKENRKIVQLMFEQKRGGTLNDQVRNGFSRIYCVLEDQPDFGQLSRICGVSLDTLGPQYGPFMLVSRFGKVRIYRADRLLPASRAGSNSATRRFACRSWKLNCNFKKFAV